MGRQIRIEYRGAFYHVMAHGNGFQWIYKTPAHLELFKAILQETVRKYKVRIHAVVLMRNHYHMPALNRELFSHCEDTIAEKAGWAKTEKIQG